MSRILITILLSIFVQAAGAGSLKGKVTDIKITGNDRLGGCMVKLDTTAPDCSSQWFSFNCSGVAIRGVTITPQAQAFRLMDAGQLAYEIGAPVKIFYDGTKINGHCLSNRIAVKPVN